MLVLTVSNRFSFHLKKHFQKVDMNPYRLAKATGMHEQYVYKICRGEQRPSDEVLNKFAAVNEMKVTLGQLRGWRALDDYTWDELIQAISAESSAEEADEKLLAFLNAFAAKFSEGSFSPDQLRDYMDKFGERYVRDGKLDTFMKDVLHEQCSSKKG